LAQDPDFRHSLNMFLPQEKNVVLPSSWLVLHVGDTFVYISPKGARFEDYESAQRYLTVVNTKQVTHDGGKARDNLDADTSEVPENPQANDDAEDKYKMICTSYFEDWLHRGRNNLLSALSWYVYSMWIYRAERRPHSETRQEQYLEIDFDPDYQLSRGYVQRVSLHLRVPQPEGMTLPTEAQDPNGNAMYKSLLYRPFHHLVSDINTGETPDPFVCLHTAENDGDSQLASDPFKKTFKAQWDRYKVTMECDAKVARKKLQHRREWESIWETKEVVMRMMELAGSGPFTDPTITNIADAREAAAQHPLVAGRLEMREYACLVAARSAENFESVALARVAPRIRRDILAKDAEEDKGIRRFAAEHDGDDGESGGLDCFDDDPQQLRDTDGCPDKPPDVLRAADWKRAWQFDRERTSKFVKEMRDVGILRDIDQSERLRHRPPQWAQQEQALVHANREIFHTLPTPACPDLDFREAIRTQYETFKSRNAPQRPQAPSAATCPSTDAPPQPPPSEQLDGADAAFAQIDTPWAMLKYLFKHVERVGDEKRKKVTLTREQVLASVTFCAMVMTAWREERDGVPLSERTCHQMILLGQGGTGKTMIVIEIFIPLVKWAFPPDREGDRWLVLAFSHAQADAISNGTVRARTLHSACAMRVQSMANSKMAPKERIDALTSTWENKVFLVNEEVSMMPAEAINMEMFRAAHGRRVKFQLNMDNYARTQELFGRMPLTLFLGDFLQLKPPKQLSLVDDLVQKARDGKSVSVEAQAAVDAFRDIDVVIELLESRRFEDEHLPELMNFFRDADGTKPMPDRMWQSLLDRSVERAGSALVSDKFFATGHVIGIFWDMVARVIVERCLRDARILDVPLIFCQASDVRHQSQMYGNSSTTARHVAHQLLTIPNIHNTGNLHGILPLHVGMRVRFTHALSSVDGLVKERQGTVEKVVVHEDDEEHMHGGFCTVQLTKMIHGAWVLCDDFDDAPLASVTAGFLKMKGEEVDTASERAKGLVPSLFIHFHSGL